MINLSNSFSLLRSLIVALSIVFAEGCAEKAATPSGKTNNPHVLTFSKSYEAKIGFPDSLVPIIRRLNGILVANAVTGNGNVQTVSDDNGITWSTPTFLNLSNSPLFSFSYWNKSLWYVSREQVPDGGQMYVYTPKKDGWNSPSPIRDTFWGQSDALQFAFDSLGTAYAVFVDYREGNADIYFSRSLDTGKTWSPNIRINDDHTGQEQTEPSVAVSSTGMVCIVWADNRNSQTLFDIYCTTSSDRGATWASNRKVNDDTTHSWQGAPSLVCNGQDFYCAWMDYRDAGLSGDVRSNIYFAFSQNNGVTWSPGIRISERSEGNSTYPNLYAMGAQSLGCLWMDSGENILNDIFFSYSSDGGVSWSSPVKANDDSMRTFHYHRSIGWLGKNNNHELYGWLSGRSGSSRVRLATLISAGDSSPAPKAQPVITPNIPRPVPFAYRATDKLFSDSFSNDSTSQWQIVSGTWVRKNHTYIGYGAPTNCSVVGRESWDDCEFTGRFKLDEFDHRAAYIYLRVSDNSVRQAYRVTNFFRRGITLEYFDRGHSTLIAEVPYSIRKDLWYTFKAVVKGSLLNYFLNDTLFISSAKLTESNRGKVGIGSENVPTYFKDIAVRKVE